MNENEMATNPLDDLNIEFEDAPQATEATSDPQQEFVRVMQTLEKNPIGRQFLESVQRVAASQFGATQAPQPAPSQPVAPTAPLQQEVEKLESEIKSYRDQGLPVPEDLAKRYYMKLGAIGAVETLAPALERTQALTLLDQRLEEAKALARQGNPLFGRYEKQFEQTFRQRAAAMPEILNNPQAFAQAVEYLDGLAMRSYVASSARNVAHDPSTGRFVSTAPAKGKETVVVPENVYGLTAENLAQYGYGQEQYVLNLAEYEGRNK